MSVYFLGGIGRFRESGQPVTLQRKNQGNEPQHGGAAGVRATGLELHGVALTADDRLTADAGQAERAAFSSIASACARLRRF
ncbi:MAG TPA: hypothetical protein VN787_03680 [Steroidobacteraceae bacterium]|nr:hypothetical protein [Steroidobacteraceae bacterium]